MYLSGVHLYPVKSTRGLAVDQAEVQPWGLRDDRRWLIVDAAGAKLRPQTSRALLTIRATPMPDGDLVLDAHGRASLAVRRPVDGPAVPVTLSRVGTAAGAGAAADAWLSEALGQPVRLVWLDDPSRRPVSPTHGGRAGEAVSLADAGPLLLTSTASLDRLNMWVTQEAARRGEPAPAPLSMARFRPNVVVDGADEPFAEDGWRRLRIGTVSFRLLEQCDRCVVTTIDPDSLERGHEPIRTLSRYRRRDRKTWFGVRLVPTGTGTIRRGDPVAVD